MNECAIKNKKELERIMSKVNERIQTILDKNGAIFEHEIERIVVEELRVGQQQDIVDEKTLRMFGIGPGSVYDEIFGERR